MLYQIKTILVTLTLFLEIGESYWLKAIENNTNNVYFNVLDRENYRREKSSLIVFCCKYIGNCQTVVF